MNGISKYGLVGYPLSHSFSRNYFRKKFRLMHINADYLNFEMADIASLRNIIADTADLKGLNITIPYKESVLSFLNELSDEAMAIGAVNTIKVQDNRQTKGFNTDYIGFRDSLSPLLQPHHSKALILGTGGAAKAVKYALGLLSISFLEVSRDPGETEIAYKDIDAPLLNQYTIIINTTPLGMAPDINAAPDIPYEHLSDRHLLYDLIYNPEETLFLQRGKSRGARIKNGLEMLIMQAEAAWNIWNE